jgi:hypothetical protein
MRVRDLPWYRRERELEALEVRPFMESRQAHRLCAKPIAHGRRCLRCTPTASTTATAATATTDGGAQRLEALKKTKKENSFLTYGGNGVRHMGKRGRVDEFKKKRSASKRWARCMLSAPTHAPRPSVCALSASHQHMSLSRHSSCHASSTSAAVAIDVRRRRSRRARRRHSSAAASPAAA